MSFTFNAEIIFCLRCNQANSALWIPSAIGFCAKLLDLNQQIIIDNEVGEKVYINHEDCRGSIKKRNTLWKHF